MLPQENFSFVCFPQEMDAKMLPQGKKISCFLEEMPLEFFLLKITPNVFPHMFPQEIGCKRFSLGNFTNMLPREN
jgi:hypothetical protein